MAVVCWRRCTTSQNISKNRNCEMQIEEGTSDVIATDANRWRAETPQTTSETVRSSQRQVAVVNDKWQQLHAKQSSRSLRFLNQSRNNLSFTEPQVSIPCGQQPVTCLSYPRFTLILSSHLRLGLLRGVFPAGFNTNTYRLLFSPTRATLIGQPIRQLLMTIFFTLFFLGQIQQTSKPLTEHNQNKTRHGRIT